MAGTARALYFTGPRSLAIEDEELRDPGPGEVMVEALVSGISAGTELNVYRGLAPQWRKRMDPKTRLFRDAGLDGGSDGGSDWTWPARYGYASVGRVASLGDGVEGFQPGELVFGYIPHGSMNVAPARALVPLGDIADPMLGIFFANINTAYNGILDARPPLGASVVVMGLGVIGQIVVRLLARAGARQVIAVDRLAPRRDRARHGGATDLLDPGDDEVAEVVRDLTGGRGADVVIEVSGAAPALNEAIRTVGFNGTVVAMSWYGGTFEGLSLSGEFHHNRPRIVSSQVGAVNPDLGPLWSVPRRAEIARTYLDELAPDLVGFITHRIGIDEAARGYALLDQGDPDVMQVVIDYGRPA